jgi:hypothetical protein
MEVNSGDIGIVVVCHQEPIFRNLKPPYVEVCVDFQTVRSHGYSHYLTKELSRLKYPEAWSEVAVLLELESFLENSRFVGIQHYRRFFSFDQTSGEAIISKPTNVRNSFIENEIGDLLKIRTQIVIPKKWEFKESALDQFVLCHPSLEELMLLTLQEFDKVLLPIFGEVSSLELMQRDNFLHPLNMFLGSREFYLDWRMLLSSVTPEIEIHAEKFDGKLQERWGGFIAERLFSVYITLCRETNRWSFIEKSVVVFDGPDELTQQRDELTQQRDELTQQRDELTQQRDELTQQRDELTQQRDELTQQRDALLNSTIWRLTKPIRHLINFFKK